MVSCPLLTNGSSELGGSLRRSYHREENGCSGCCHPHFSGVCLCCAWSNLGLRQGGVRARTGHNGISLQHWTKLQLFWKWQQSKLNAADKFEKFQTTKAFFSLSCAFFVFSAHLAQPPLCSATALSAAILLTDSLESCAAIVHTVAVPLFYLCGPAQPPNQILANTLSLNSSSHSSL